MKLEVLIMEFRASHILIKDKNLADKLAKEAKGGANFAQLARRYSTCPSKSKGGDLGWFKPGQMVPAFENAVKKMSYGRISDPVRTQFGYHIIKKTGMKE
jgi:peptidyl-prolyl cis-trans isomerase C